MPDTSLQELSDVPVGDMVQAMAAGIAQAQFELDMMSTRIAEMLAGAYQDEENPGKLIDARVDFGGEQLSLMELGFTPTFYQFIETVIEVKVSVSTSRESSSERTESSSTTTSETKRRGFLGLGGSTTTTRTSSVSARYASRFQYSAEGASLIRTKLVPVPPPTVLQERMLELAQDL
ncbi:MAG: hypothetical protein HUU38_17580 [Anaerolineales bacterium]|nr:hypothetical protein [Anaerolineales bacterium]